MFIKMAFTNKINRIKCFNLFDSFSTSKCFVLFEVIFLLRFDNLESNSLLVINFACAILELKTAANLLISEVQIYLSLL